MAELVRAGELSWYLDFPAKIGFYVPDGETAYLIDSGSDKDAGRKVRQALEQNGWKLKAILNTHSHADHVGGNRYLQNQTGCAIFVPGIEADFTRHPLLEPSLLIGGYPCKELRHKFLMAQESEVQELTAPGFPQEVEPISLPGHFFKMCGYRLPDGTVFLADCVSSMQTLEKYGVPFLYDVGAYLETLDKICELEGRLFVPSHAEAVADIRPLAACNREKILAIADTLCEICREGKTFEAALREVFAAYSLTMTFQQYALVGSTVKSFLCWLHDVGRMAVSFEENLLLWKTENC